MRYLIRFFNQKDNTTKAIGCLSISKYAEIKHVTAKVIRDAVAMEDLDYSLIGDDIYILMTKKSIRWTKDRHRLYCKVVELEAKKYHKRSRVSKDNGIQERQQPKGWEGGA